MFERLTEFSVCVISVCADVFLALLKLIFAKLTASYSLLSDGVHSCADSATSFITLLGVKAGKNPDKKEKAEAFTCRFIASVLFVTGLSLMINSLRDIILGSVTPAVGSYAVGVSFTALLIKEFLFLFSRYAAKKTGSCILNAQAWHHQSDALSCVGSFIGTAGSCLGFPVADKIAGIVISLMIIWSATEILRAKKP